MSITAQSMGTSQPRIEGPQKVAGTARYAFEHPVVRPLYLHPVQSTIARGRITAVDASAADSLELGDLDLLPTQPDWAGGLREAWEPGEESAQRALRRFLRSHVEGYAARRDVPSSATTSRLSPHLRWGELSPHQVWHAAGRARQQGAPGADITRFLTELGWREFAWHTLYHFPDLATRNWRRDFDDFPCGSR